MVFDSEEIGKDYDTLKFKKKYALSIEGKRCNELSNDSFFKVESKGSPSKALYFLYQVMQIKKIDLKRINKRSKKYENEIKLCVESKKAITHPFLVRSYYVPYDATEYFEIYLDNCIKDQEKILVIHGNDIESKANYAVRSSSVYD